MLTMLKQTNILSLHKQGKKKTDIANEEHCHRNTVYNIVKRGKLVEIQTRNKPSRLQTYKERIQEYRNKNLSAVLMYEKLSEEPDFQESYSTLCRYINKAFPKEIEAFGVQQTLPGEVVEIDFGEVGVYPGNDGKTHRTFGFAAILHYSKKRYYGLVQDQKLETLCREMTSGFTYFGGVPQKAKVDNMKTAVFKNQHYQLELNQNFLEYATHYGFAIVACTPYSPWQKGGVEGGIKYLQGNFIPGRTFTDLSDMNRQCREWTVKVNSKVHGTTKKIPSQVFEREEKQTLLPLPQEAFSFFNRCERVVWLNCHINFESNYYSVPFSYVEKTVSVRWNEQIVRIIYHGEEIALHKRTTGTGNFITQSFHLPADKIYSEKEFQLRHETKMREIGTNAYQYFHLLLKKQPRYWQQTLRPIYGMVAEYGAVPVDKALGRVVLYGAIDVRIIRNILEKKLYEIVETVEVPDFSDTGNSRELTYYLSPSQSESVKGDER